MRKGLQLIGSVFLAMSFCTAAYSEVEKVKTVEEKKAIVYQKETGRASRLKTIRTRFNEPTMGVIRGGIFCLKTGNLLWNQKSMDYVTGNFRKIYLEELKAAHYPVAVQKDSMFQEAGDKEKNNDLEVGAFIQEINANFCQFNGTKGGVSLKIFWQVFAPEVQKVVFEATTEGSYQTEEKEKNQRILFNKAFAVATRNLLAEPGFLQVIASGSPTGLSTIKTAKIKIKGVGFSGDNSKMDITKIRSAVATIISDKGTGSGFFINTDGYLLSNYHVVGESRFVKVKLATGRELVGEVIRSDKNRDVALLKTEPISVTPISLRRGDLNIGEDVYAIGSPLGHGFNTSLTKGILSGYRDISDKKYLQSDVTILPGNSGGPLLDSSGNAVAITLGGVVKKGFSGMNFFIPISDALSKLAVEVE